MFPIVCTGCGTRGKVASIPLDLACVACGTGAHLDLDDKVAVARVSPDGSVARTAARTALGDPSLPAGLLPNDQPEMGRLTDTTSVTEDLRCAACFHEWTHTVADPAAPVPPCPACASTATSAAGATKAARLSKQADLAGIRNLLAQFNGQSVTCTYDDDLGIHTTAGTLTYHPPSVIVGRSVTTDFHVLAVESTSLNETPIPVGPADDSGSLLAGAFAAKTAGPRSACSSCGHEWTSRSPLGPERCPACSSSDLRSAARQAALEAKVEQIAAAVQASNPGLPRATAMKVALKTVGLYPKVAG